jgi:hypothetical protein
MCNSIVDGLNILPSISGGLHRPSFARRRETSLFDSNKTSYVPDGLSEDEYQKIKQKEADELASKNFGAWGPRFKRTATPDGDWLLMRNLWTSGFNANESMNGSSGSVSRRGASRVAAFVRRYGPAFILGYSLVETVVSAVLVARASQLTIKSALKIAFRVTTWSAIQRWDFVGRANLAKCAVACVLTWPASTYIEQMNRKRLWSPQRTLTTSLAVLLGFLNIWSIVVTKVKPFPAI